MDFHENPWNLMEPHGNRWNSTKVSRQFHEVFTNPELLAHLKVIIDTNAGKPLEGHQETLWEKFARQAGEGGYAPFESKEEWELSHWLSTEGLSQGAIDHFWKLKWVSHNFLFTH